MQDRNKLIELYFRLGLSQNEVVGLLAFRHNIFLSTRHLRRILQHMHLARRKNYTNLTEVASFIQDEVQKSGQLHGYRWLYVKCLLKGFVVRKEDVRLLLQILDPEGVHVRKRRRLRRRAYFVKGPNFLWHIDGYDKLKPYGLCISGCIDGYSRKIMWLNVFNTNNNPKVIAGYFMEAVIENNGCPLLVRADRGTENCDVATIQQILHCGGTGSQAENCFIEGRSTANQRIEAWWSILRRESSQFWIELLAVLKNEGSFSGSDLDKNLIQFCFTRLLQAELDSIVSVWNAHIIRPVRDSNMPHGRPFTMFNFPEMFGGRNYLCAVTEQDCQDCLEETIIRGECPCKDKDIFEVCKILQNENGWVDPDEPYKAVDLYLNLQRVLLNELEI